MYPFSSDFPCTKNRIDPLFYFNSFKFNAISIHETTIRQYQIHPPITVDCDCDFGPSLNVNAVIQTLYSAS